MGDHLPRTAHQARQQLEFRRRQMDYITIAADPVVGQINQHIALLIKRDGRAHRVAAMAQCHAHTRQQLADAKRFDQIIIGAFIQQADFLPLSFTSKSLPSPSGKPKSSRIKSNACAPASSNWVCPYIAIASARLAAVST